jgi:putative ABC transport system permease protein
MDTFFKDLRLAARMLIKRPGFAAVAIITLALGIGPTTAIFSLINGILLKPLPYGEPDRIVNMWRSAPERGWREYPFSVPNFIDYRDRNESFEHIAAFTRGSFALAGDGEPEMVEGCTASAGLFSVLGVEPALGRAFLKGDDAPGAAPIVVLGHALWQRRFAGDPAIEGKSITINGRSYTVAGVMPPGREFPANSQIWIPITLNPESPRGSHFLNVIARLKPGGPIEQAGSEMNAIAVQLEQEHPQFNAGARVDLVPLAEQSTGNVRAPLVVLFVAILFVLLIACANVANLLLARASGRTREFAIRSALGAGRARLVRQLITESMLLAVLGGALGWLLAAWTRDLLLALSPLRVNRVYEDGFDLRVLVFASTVVLLTGIVFGLVPAMRAARKDFQTSLNEATVRATGGKSGGRLRGGLVIAEVALALVLLVGAGLLVRSFIKLNSVEPGFNSGGVLTLNVSLPQSRYGEQPRRAQFINQALDALRRVPGATGVASAAYAPLEEMRTSRRFWPEGHPEPESGKEPNAVDIPVSPDYFRLLEIPILQGRAFSESDNGQAPGVVIVNRSFARRFFGSEDATGRRIRFYSSRPQDPPPPWIEIVGVVGDVRQARLNAEAEPIIYSPQLQRLWSFMTFMVRTDADPPALARAAREAIYSVDKDQAIASLAPLDEVVARSMAERKGMMFLLAAFATLALMLSLVGLFGVVSYTAAMRTREIGIRMALGATPGSVFKLVLRQGLGLTAAGVIIGAGASLLLTGYLSAFLYDIGPGDLITFLFVPLVLMLVALAASAVPARRATRIDPMVALRHE